ncbi:MAG: hypothetical protein WCK02_17950 [Bacteroidota bacterium]
MKLIKGLEIAFFYDRNELTYYNNLNGKRNDYKKQLVKDESKFMTELWNENK